MAMFCSRAQAGEYSVLVPMEKFFGRAMNWDWTGFWFTTSIQQPSRETENGTPGGMAGIHDLSGNGCAGFRLIGFRLVGFRLVLVVCSVRAIVVFALMFAWAGRLHTVALKDLLACRAEFHPVLLQTLLHSRVIPHLFSAKTRGIPGASLLLLLRALMFALGKTCGAANTKQRHDHKRISHLDTPLCITPVFCRSSRHLTIREQAACSADQHSIGRGFEAASDAGRNCARQTSGASHCEIAKVRVPSLRAKRSNPSIRYAVTWIASLRSQ